MFDFLTLQIIIISIVFSITAIIHGAFGIGFPMLPTAILSQYLNMQEVIILTLWPSLCINVLIVYTGGPLKQIVKRYWLLATTALIGSGVGTYLLFVVAQATVQLILALAIFIYVYIGFRGYKIDISPDNNWLMIAFGFVAGVIGGATNAMAPILMIYLFSVTDNRNELAQATNLCFLLGKIIQTIIIYRIPTTTTPDFELLAFLLIITIGALFIGVSLRHRIPVAQFRTMILIILLILGIGLATQSVWQLL